MNREFVWNVVNTHRPDDVKRIVAAAMERRRMRNLQDSEKRKVLVVTAEMLQKLDTVNLLRRKYISSHVFMVIFHQVPQTMLGIRSNMIVQENLPKLLCVDHSHLVVILSRISSICLLPLLFIIPQSVLKMHKG